MRSSSEAPGGRSGGACAGAPRGAGLPRAWRAGIHVFALGAAGAPSPKGYEGRIVRGSVSGRPPVSLRIEAPTVDALFDASAKPVFPHTRRRVEDDLAEYLEDRAREHTRASGVEIVVALGTSGSGPSAEEEAGREVRAFFRAERELAELKLRVNQREGWGFLRRSMPLLLGALLVAGVLYLFGPDFPVGPIGDLVTTLFYLLFITIVWVLLWDPIEKLLFDAYLIRSEIAALGKLAEATVRFVPDRGAPNSTAPLDSSALRPANPD